MAGDEQEGAEASDPGQLIPARYRESDTALKFDVPADGASNADFKLTRD